LYGLVKNVEKKKIREIPVKNAIRYLCHGFVRIAQLKIRDTVSPASIASMVSLSPPPLSMEGHFYL